MDIAVLGDTMDDIIKGINSLTALGSGTAASGLSSSDTHQLENLAKLLKQIQHHVQKLNYPQGPNPKLLLCLGQLKDVVFDLSDLVEDLSANASRHKEPTTATAGGNAVTKRIRSYLFKSNRVRNRLKVKFKIRKIAEQLKGVASNLSEEARKKSESTNLANSDNELEERVETIGREKEKKDIIDQLLFKNGETAVPVTVVTIVGVEGIGKTKLAQFICEDKQVKDRFGLPIWVNGIHETLDEESIAERVTESASAATDRKCFLLVLDDLRFETRDESPTTLQHKLTEGLTTLQRKLTEVGLSDGAILITTRSNLVANIKASCYSKVLERLDEPESWSLFQRIRVRGYATDDSANDIKQDIEKNVLRNCGGVPLAIIIAAKLLNSRGSQVLDEALVAELDEFLENQEFSFYEELPTPQKQCFAYFSLFPEDYLIDAERLIQLWMGEGFLARSSNPEELGQKYLEDFITRCIFQ